MTRKTVTRADLVESVFKQVGLFRTQSAGLVELVLDEICSAITHGGTVMLSSFGTFQAREKSERIGRNPKTGAEAPIFQRRVVTFKASHIKDQVLSARLARLDPKPNS